jgi:hypothetical protein
MMIAISISIGIAAVIAVGPDRPVLALANET